MPAHASALSRLGLPDGMSRLAAALVVAGLAAALVSIGSAQTVLAAARAWVVDYFDWLFVGVAKVTFFGVRLEAQRGVDTLEAGACHGQAAHDQGVAGLHVGLGQGVLRDHQLGGDVARAQVLGQGAFHQRAPGGLGGEGDARHG